MAAYHLGSSELWDSIFAGVIAQASMWLGDMGSVVMVVMGLGIVILIISALVSLWRL